MILIADSGSTKTHWVLINGKSVEEEIYTTGFNPYYYDTREFEEALKKDLAGNLPVNEISHIYFYGAGVSSDANRAIVERALLVAFPDAVIETHHDLHGAAIALLGRKKGIACILGTGSNSCLWDGQKIVANVPSLGYLLGDEGGGTYLGKLLVRDVLMGDAGGEIKKLFFQYNQLDFARTLDRIYKQPDPNLFFSQQTRFVRDHIDQLWFRQLVQRNFRDFVKVQLSKYPDYKTLPVCFVGSVAYNFRDILEEVLSENGITPGKIIKEPMEGMVEYYLGG